MSGIKPCDDREVIRESGGGERRDERLCGYAALPKRQQVRGVVTFGVVVTKTIERYQQDVRFGLLGRRIQRMRGLAEGLP
jgi:hypothetical protein